MLTPDNAPGPDDRVTLPFGILDRAVQLLMELPARASMDVLLAIREHTELAVLEDGGEA